jgi:hypothetical protein
MVGGEIRGQSRVLPEAQHQRRRADTWLIERKGAKRNYIFILSNNCEGRTRIGYLN